MNSTRQAVLLLVMSGLAGPLAAWVESPEMVLAMRYQEGLAAMPDRAVTSNSVRHTGSRALLEPDTTNAIRSETVLLPRWRTWSAPSRERQAVAPQNARSLLAEESLWRPLAHARSPQFYSFDSAADAAKPRGAPSLRPPHGDRPAERGWNRSKVAVRDGVDNNVGWRADCRDLCVTRLNAQSPSVSHADAADDLPRDSADAADHSPADGGARDGRTPQDKLSARRIVELVTPIDAALARHAVGAAGLVSR